MGCTRLNPGFGDGTDEAEGTGGATTGALPTGVVETTAGDGTGSLTSGTGSGSTSSATPDTDSGPTDPPPPVRYLCDADQFDILVSPSPPQCAATGRGNPRPVTIDADCMSIHAEGSALVGSRATGCETDECTSNGDGAITLSTEYINLGDALEIGNSTVCRYVWAYGYPINGDLEGDCSWEALAIWRPNGELDLAVGNGLPDDGFPEAVGRPGTAGVPVSSTILEDLTTCGLSDGVCARAGWRSFRFAEMEQPALPDAIPMNAFLGRQALSVVNHGLLFDLSCDRFGRWGVVPKGREPVLTPR